jgi:hypothetical protein
VWEIHPVYAIDVCRFRSKAKCTAEGSAWIPLHEWLSEEEEEEQ